MIWQYMALIDWLNKNQGFVMALLTLIYVIATVGIAAIMIWSNRLTRRSLTLAVELDRRRSRPYVVFDIEFRRSLLFAVPRNCGRTAAYGIRLTLEPQLQHTLTQPMEISPLVEREIAFLAPDRSLEDLVGTWSKFSEYYPTMGFKGRLCYQDAEGQKYDEIVSINLDSLQRLLYTTEKDIGQEIEKLTKAIQELGKRIPTQR